MNRAKTLYRRRLLSFPKIVITSFLFFGLLLFANLVIAQSSSHNGRQWNSVGGQMVASGEGHFSNTWLAAWRWGSGDGKYWKNDEPKTDPGTNAKIPATHTAEEVTKDVLIRKGQITVRGPGYLGLFVRSKGAGAVLKFPKSGHVFHAQGLGEDKWLTGPDKISKWHPGDKVNIDPTQTLGGWVPVDRIMTLDVWVYNPFTDWAIWGRGYGAPKSVEYEFWFFPREGGEVIKVDRPQTQTTLGKTVKDKVDNLPPGAAGYVMSIMGSKDGKIVNVTTGKTLKKGDVFYFSDVFRTHDVMVKMILNYPDAPLVVLKANTKVRLENKEKYVKGGIFNFFGKLLFKGSGKDHQGFKIVTSNAITSVEGTSYEVDYDPITSKTTVSVFEGTVRLDCIKGKADPVMLNAGMQATMDNNCSNTSSMLDPDNNTPAKVGWEVDAEPNNIDDERDGEIVSIAPIAQAQGTARLLTVSSNQNMVGRNETLRGNGKTDAVFQAQFSAPNRTVTAVEVSNTNGLRSVWDTRPNNRLWLGAVVIGGRPMNRSDGSVNFSLGSDQNTLDFFVEDNGSISGGKTNYRMTISFASGDPLVMNITQGGGGGTTGGGSTGGDGNNLLINGSFEKGKPAGSSYVTINPGSTDLPGWQITGKNIDVVGSAWNSSHGPRAVDIDGTSPGGIRQSFATTPGMVYSVSFDLAGNPWAGPQVKTVHVDIPGIVQKTYQFDIKGKSPRNMGWTRHSFTFRATQTRSTLHIFSNHPPGNGAGPAVDNVVVIASTGGGQTGLDRVDGRWSSTFGVIHFPNSSGGDLRASYTSGGGRIIGKLNGRRLTGIWVQNSSGKRCNTARDGSYHWGRMEFTFNQKLNEFNGVWGYCEDLPAAVWTGKKK